MISSLRRTSFLLACLALFAGAAPAQTVRVAGYGETDLDVLLRKALSDNPLIITRDTLVRAGDTIRGNVFVVKRRFILEGTIIGDLTAVQANVYLRPPARVTGRVTNVAGGLYPSEQARMGSVQDRPLAPYTVSGEGDNYIIGGMRKLPAISWMGGAQLPDYNRVDGLRVEVGPKLELPPLGALRPVLKGSAGYATERGDFLYRAQLAFERGRSSLRFGWEDNVTLTNEEWIRSRLSNSAAMIWNGKDLRDYYEAQRSYVEFHRYVERGARITQFVVRGQREHASPLRERDVFAIFKPDSVRPNLRVSDSVISSAIAGLESAWLGRDAAYEVSGMLEFAVDALDADYTFNAFNAHAEWAMKAVANHTLEIEGNFRGPLPGTDDLPLQRWTFVGGSGTLYTEPTAKFRGDRLAFVETEYRIPFARRFKAPFIGRPTLRLMHNIGMAWSRGGDSGFEQNIGARLQFPFAYVRVITNPNDLSGEAKFSAGISLAGKGYPWENAR